METIIASIFITFLTFSFAQGNLVHAKSRNGWKLKDPEATENLVLFPKEREIVTVFPKKGVSIDLLRYYSASGTTTFGNTPESETDVTGINIGSIYAISDKVALQFSADIVLSRNLKTTEFNETTEETSKITGLLDPYFSVIFDLNNILALKNNNNFNTYLAFSPKLQEARNDNAAFGRTDFGVGVVFGRSKNISLPWSVGLEALSIGESKDRGISSSSLISGYGSLRVLKIKSATFSVNFKAKINGESTTTTDQISFKTESFTSLSFSGNVKFKLQDLAYLDLSFLKELKSSFNTEINNTSFDSSLSGTILHAGVLVNF